MKDLQIRTRGMLKDSNEYANIKNDVFRGLRSHLVANNTNKEDMVTADFDSYYINLIVIPEVLECYEIMHIMQYNQILFHLEEDNCLWSKFGMRDIRKDMGFSKDDKWPFLLVDSSTPNLPTADLQGKENIIKYFTEINLMTDVMNHSGYEKQGLSFVTEKAIPAFELLKLTLKGLLQFYFTSKNFRYSKVTFQYRIIQKSFIWKIFKSFYYYIAKFSIRWSNRENVKQRYQIFHDVIDEWEKRLDKNNFHGGKEPDAADFKMYSLCNAHMHMFVVKNLLNTRNSDESKFKLWYQLMNQQCRNMYS